MTSFNVPIYEFKGEFSFLSNFHRAWVILQPVNGIWAHPTKAVVKGPSAEHVFQVCKVEWRGRYPSEIEEEMQWILGQEAPALAKKAGGPQGLQGRKIMLREDWEEVKVVVMLHILRAKFVPGSELAERLVKTSPRVLIEGNTWGDEIWGVVNRGHGRGKNMLGRLLMLVREELLVAEVANLPVEALR